VADGDGERSLYWGCLGRRYRGEQRLQPVNCHRIGSPTGPRPQAAASHGRIWARVHVPHSPDHSVSENLGRALAFYSSLGFAETVRLPTEGEPIHVEGYKIGIASVTSTRDDPGLDPVPKWPASGVISLDRRHCRGLREVHRERSPWTARPDARLSPREQTAGDGKGRTSPGSTEDGEKRLTQAFFGPASGGGGIRTLGRVSPSTVFKTALCDAAARRAVASVATLGRERLSAVEEPLPRNRTAAGKLFKGG
jgi:hypothetical protein